MIGKLTIDKASMNLSYFLYTIKIISDNNGRISRTEFGKQMGTFIGIPSVKGGKENRTPYNKSKLPRYFGFVDIEHGDGNEIFLVLTHRGLVLKEYIEDKGEGIEASQRYGIYQRHRLDFIDLIFESVIFDSFGKNNCGAEQSNTDVEPPKVVFKTIFELGSASAEEICYVMFGLNRGDFKSFEEAIKTIESNRKNGKHNYKQITDEWKITNIVNDCKIINIFTDENIGLLTAKRDDTGKIYYSLSNTLDERHKDQIKAISVTYRPVRLFAYTNRNVKAVQQWVNDTVLGRVSDESLVFRYNLHSDDKFCFDYSNNGKLIPGIFEKALLKAFQEENKNIYVVVEGISELILKKRLGDMYPLLKYIDNFLDNHHGWSSNSVENERLYEYLIKESNNAKRYLEYKMVKFPSNLHIVGAIIMNENDIDKVEFDYEFQRCLVNIDEKKNVIDSGANTPDEKSRVSTGSNILLYGVPGSGKSWTIAQEYCKDEDCMERLVFHPDYMYSDFVGQILPIVKEDDEGKEKVRYEFTPGPFTKILRKAYLNPSNSYYLIIEEINRGNAPAIFGEIFQLLDRQTEDSETYKKGTSEYGITNDNIASEVYGDSEKKVRIPANLSIIGTMNTSDQNVFTLDTAFQRRWIMRMIPNSFKGHKFAENKILDTEVSWQQFCEAINEEILRRNNVTSSEDKRLGAYFVSADDLDFKKETDNANEKEKIEVIHKNARFAEKVLKYLWDDAFKFSHADTFDTRKYKSLEMVIDAFNSTNGNDRFKVFHENLRKLIIEGVDESNVVSESEED